MAVETIAPPTATPSQPTKAAEPGSSQENRRFAAVLISPAQLLLYLIMVFPLTVVMYLSFSTYSPIAAQGKNWWDAHLFWTWANNYTNIFADSQFWQAILRTILLVGIAVPLEFLI